jgi:NAD(P)-dependent dehydrogenase (short-subunit alcohol dehydrogenase family)
MQTQNTIPLIKLQKGNLTAVKLANMGAQVFAGCLTDDGIGSLKRNGSPNLRPFLMNVTSEKSVIDAVEFIKGETDQLWSVINNAGIAGVTAPFDWVKLEDFNKVIDVNLIGTVRVTKAFLPFLKRTKVLINICGRKLIHL